MEQAKKTKLLFCGIITIIILVIFFILMVSSNKFWFGTTINGIDVSHLTKEDTITRLYDTYNNRFIHIGDQEVAFSKLIKPIDMDKIEKTGIGEYKIKLQLKNDFINIINENRLNDGVAKSITKKGSNFIINDGEPSNKIDKKKIEKDLTHALEQNGDVTLDENKYLVHVEDPIGFSETVEKIKQLENYKVDLKFKGIVEELDSDKIADFYDLSTDVCKLIINRDEVLKYIKALDEKYNTLGNLLEYTTLSGKTIQLSGYGQYGWDLDWEKSTDKLIYSIENFSNEADLVIDKDNKFSLSNPRVEIDLANQKMFLIKDDKVIESTGVVTGKPSTPTHKGIFKIYAKEINRILRGDNGDGSRYAVPVKYWMPFDGGIGIHDVPGRPPSAYEDPSTYLVSGSHGCINTPLSKVSVFYNNLSVGDNVIVY